MMHVHAYAVTPFCPDNVLEVNIDGLRKNLTFLVENGVKVIVVGGGTGEVEMLSDEELRQVATTALEIAGDRALVIPTVPDNLKRAVTLLKEYVVAGAEVVLSMPPYIRHQVPDDLSGVFNYYQTLADASDVALLPYNTQGWPATFIGRLAEIDGVIGIKDPCKQPYTLYEAIRLVGDRLVWIGNKRHQSEVLQYHFQAGVQGFTAGLINVVPKFELEMQEAGMQGDWERLIQLQRTVAPLEALRDRYGDAAMLKGGLDLIGLAGGPVRPPRVDMPEEGCRLLRAELRRLGCEVEEADE
jgi:dihydrodipicolinate synthase/N-acetylneuraminate lyase